VIRRLVVAVFVLVLHHVLSFSPMLTRRRRFHYTLSSRTTRRRVLKKLTIHRERAGDERRRTQRHNAIATTLKAIRSGQVRPFYRYRFRRVVTLSFSMRVVALALLFAAAARCKAAPPVSDRCAAPPAGNAVAFIEGQPMGEISLHAAVDRITAKDGATVYDLGPRRLVYRSDGPIPGLRENTAYDFVLDYRPGYPSASTLTISDERGVMFVAMTSQQPKDIAGFQFTMTDGGCSSRTHNRCYDAIVNQRLHVAHKDKSVDLMNGESAPLGGYRVRVLTAQKVKYNSNCADAGIDGVSFTILRER